MVSTPPQARPDPPPLPGPGLGTGPSPLPPSLPSALTPQTQVYDYGSDAHNTFFETDFANDPRTSNHVLRRGSLIPAATAAAALASLHNHRAEFDWDSDPVRPRPTDWSAFRCADTSAVNRMPRQRRIPSPSSPAHASPRLPWNSTWARKSPTTPPPRFSTSCCPRHSRNLPLSAPRRCHPSNRTDRANPP